MTTSILNFKRVPQEFSKEKFTEILPLQRFSLPPSLPLSLSLSLSFKVSKQFQPEVIAI